MDGTRTKFRTREEIKIQKNLKSGGFVNNWFMRNGANCVLMMQATPEGKLANKIQSMIGQIKGQGEGKTKIVEKGGCSVLKG